MVQPVFQTHIIKNSTLLESLKRYTEEVDSDFVSFDTETNNKNPKLAKLYGIGLAFTDKTAFYIPWRNPDGTDFWSLSEYEELHKYLKQVLLTKKVIGHNVIYDALVTENNINISIDNSIEADTILMRHTLNEDGPFALKEIAVEEFGPWADKAQDKLKEEVLAAGGRWTEEEKDMCLASTDTLGEYCCWDVLLTRMLYDLYDDKLKKENLQDLFYKEEIMPLYKENTLNMKRLGFPVDLKHYQKLKSELSIEIEKLEDDIMLAIKKDISAFEDSILEEKAPLKPSGNFPKVYAEIANIPLPVDKKSNKVTLKAKDIKAQKELYPQHAELYDYILQITPRTPLDPVIARKTQESLYFSKQKEGRRYIFNLGSNDHLIELLVNIWGFSPLERTEKTNKPKIDDEFIESLKGNPVVDKLKDLKKLKKLLSTYVDGILERQLDGNIYTSMLQFGTTSGRYSSQDPNLQNQPRIKEEDSGLSQLVLKYVNEIRKGFIAGKGYKVVNADYSSLEPRCFAHMSGDEKLREVFRKNEDLYSSVAINVFALLGVSAYKKDPNFLGTLFPEKRDIAKRVVLAIPYGAEAARISELLGISYKEAQEIIDNYLGKYVDLRKYMLRQNYTAKQQGFVKTELGRVRHLREAKAIYALYGDDILNYKWANKNNRLDIRRKFKNALNNAKNFPIQGLAAHIVNRAMITMTRKFKEEGLDASVRLQVHDEITVIAREDQAERVKEIMKYCMENTTKISIPLIAEPLIADNWADAK